MITACPQKNHGNLQLMKSFPLTALILLLTLGLASAPAMDDGEPMPPGDDPVGETLDQADPGGQPTAPVIELPPPADGPDPLVSTIRVNSTLQPNDPRLPWRKANIESRSGLGVLIADHQVLITASMVADATHIELEQPESGRKVSGRVLAVDHEAELAIVTTAEDEDADLFFAGTEPIELDEPATTGDSLHVWQIEANGRPVVTPVQLLRIEVGRYNLDTQQLLTYQGQGSIRSHAGSYTVPVMRDGRLTGLMMRYDNNQQLSTILPAPIIQQFLASLDNGRTRGFPNLGIQFSPTLDEQFRRYLGIDDITGGIFIRRVLPGSSAEKAGIQEGDVLLAADNYNIDARGFYEDPVFGRLAMSHLFSGSRLVGDELEVIVWRDNQEVTLNVLLDRRDFADFLVEPHMIDRATPFIIAGGLVFQELNEPFLRAFGRNWSNDAPARLLQAWRNPELFEQEGRRKLVFLNGVIPTPAVQGYEQLGALIVARVNGIAIHKIEDLARALEQPVRQLHDQPVDDLHIIEFTDFPYIIHVDAAAAERDNAAIIQGTYRIPETSRMRAEPLAERTRPEAAAADEAG